ncbi:hypothetical protein JOD63_000286 [Microbacterium terrae]|uniref:Murein DD-endopeptidase MepM n=1 Tax=Microbacterium terrae TaxID=69369 RepID=A0A0M2H216_9MICO|nr:M23 family metallopeptidase [Microbacterium terrae]KJL37489.1 Murein DD-endopeptidase MepM [Microbacterium terrae]MBP1076318.1 hypothetical protein [Microbacterium terrae]
MVTSTAAASSVAEPTAPVTATPAPAAIDHHEVTVAEAIAPVAPTPPITATPASVAPAAASAPEVGSRRARRVVAPLDAEPVTVAIPEIAPVAPVEPPRAEPAFLAEIRMPSAETATAFDSSAPSAPHVEPVATPTAAFELIEPVVDTTPVAFEPAATESTTLVETTPISTASTDSMGAAPKTAEHAAPTADTHEAHAPVIDEFEASARLFSFTSETPVQQATAESVDGDAAAGGDEAPARERTHTAPRRSRMTGASFKRVTAASFSMGIMGVVGLLTVGMTTPVTAVAAASGIDQAAMSVVAPGDVAPEGDEIQAYVAPATAESDTLQRSENYGTTTAAEMASEAGISNFSNLFVNDPTAAIQWPFAVGVSMSYGFGWRSGRMHEGIDFTPGNGAPIQAIADGTVRVASEAGGAYGVHVIIDHVIDGQLISSHYAHMQYGSLQVTAGQKVTVGTILGRTGNTGRSYGAHTHFELLMNGTTAIDPMPWLRENAGRDELG